MIASGARPIFAVPDSADADTLLAVKDSVITATIIMKNFNIGTGQTVVEKSFPFKGDTDKLFMTARRLVWSAVGVEPPPGRFPEDLINNKVSLKEKMFSYYRNILLYYRNTLLPWFQDNTEMTMIIGGLVLISGGWLLFGGGGGDDGGSGSPPTFPEGPSSEVQL